MAKIYLNGFEGGVASNVSYIQADTWAISHKSSFPGDLVPPSSEYALTMRCSDYGGEAFHLMVNEFAPNLSTFYMKARCQYEDDINTPSFNYWDFFCGEGSLFQVGITTGPLFYATINGITYPTTTVLAGNTWYVIELYVVISTNGSTSNGIFKMAIDGVTEIDLTSIITNPYDVQRYLEMLSIRTYCQGYAAYDDFVFADDDQIGSGDYDSYIVRYVPNADNTDNWDKNTVSYDAYEVVGVIDDEATVDAYYIYTTQPELENFAIGAAGTFSFSEILSAQATFRILKDSDPEDFSTLESSITVGGTEYTGTVSLPQTLYANTVGTVWEENPYTSLPWEVADLSGMYVGIKTVT